MIYSNQESLTYEYFTQEPQNKRNLIWLVYLQCLALTYVVKLSEAGTLQ